MNIEVTAHELDLLIVLLTQHLSDEMKNKRVSEDTPPDPLAVKLHAARNQILSYGRKVQG